MQAQGRDFDLFVLEQSPGLRFNRGALLNAGALLLAGSRYDHFVFHDVDTLPQLKANIGYSFPSGARPLHMTPQGIHPRVNYEVRTPSELSPCLHLLPQRRFLPQRMPAPPELQSLGGASRVSGQHGCCCAGLLWRRDSLHAPAAPSGRGVWHQLLGVGHCTSLASTRMYSCDAS